jgi:hypothetical protein
MGAGRAGVYSLLEPMPSQHGPGKRSSGPEAMRPDAAEPSSPHRWEVQVQW